MSFTNKNNQIQNMKYPIKSLSLLLMAGSITLAACGDSSETTSTTTTDTTTTTTSAPAAGTGGTSNMDSGANTGNATVSDAQWVSDAVAMNMAEINAHTAAQAHAATSDVKTHAKHMLTDHKKMGDEMKAYASKKNYTLPTAPPAEKAQMLEDMNNTKKGKDWDMAYLNAQVNDHNEAIAKFESGEKTVTDPELKAMITKTLPTLRDHLKMVQDAQAKMK
jgi:putative membrane protein